MLVTPTINDVNKFYLPNQVYLYVKTEKKEKKKKKKVYIKKREKKKKRERNGFCLKQ